MKYDDILYKQRPKSSYPKMTRMNRAAQFAPFSALVGHSESILEVNRATVSKIELDENAKEEINRKLNEVVIRDKEEVKFIVFIIDDKKEGGNYHEIKGVIKKIDEIFRVIELVDKRIIQMDDIYDIQFDS